jgi:hypothetical protein
MLDHAAATRLHRQLTELPELLAFAYLALMPGNAPRGGRVSGDTRTAPLPCRLDVLDALVPSNVDDTPVIGLLPAWARVVIDDRRAANDWTAFTLLPIMPREVEASAAIKYLRFHLPFAVTRVYAPDLADEIGRLHRHLDRVAGRPIKTARPVRTACPNCQLLALCERTDGERECLSCRETFSPDEYGSRVARLLAELDAAA